MMPARKRNSNPNTKKNKYKRKFLVPGDTPDKRKFYEKCCRNCSTEDRKRKTGGLCSGIGDLGFPWFHIKDCPHGDELYPKYIVSETHDGKWQCACKGWIFKYRKAGQDCAHIKKAKAHPEKYEIAVEFTGRLTGVFDKVFKE